MCLLLDVLVQEATPIADKFSAGKHNCLLQYSTSCPAILCSIHMFGFPALVCMTGLKYTTPFVLPCPWELNTPSIYTLYALTCRELKMVKNQANTAALRLTVRIPNTHVSPRRGRRITVATKVVLSGGNKYRIYYIDTEVMRFSYPPWECLTEAEPRLNFPKEDKPHNLQVNK